MAWESVRIVLACGCDGNVPWQDDIVGVETRCAKHGQTYVERGSRIYEARTSRDMQLGVKVSSE